MSQSHAIIVVGVVHIEKIDEEAMVRDFLLCFDVPPSRLLLPFNESNIVHQGVGCGGNE